MQWLKTLLLRVQSIQPEENTFPKIAAVSIHSTTIPDVVGGVRMSGPEYTFTYEQCLHSHVVWVGDYFVEFILGGELGGVVVRFDWIVSDVEALVE